MTDPSGSPASNGGLPAASATPAAVVAAPDLKVVPAIGGGPIAAAAGAAEAEAAKVKAAGAGTVLDVSDTDPPDTNVPQDWPADWREKFAGADDKAKAFFARYGSPADVAKALLAAQAKIRSGMKISMPDNPTEAELAEYRTANGIPAHYKDYDTNLGDGLVIGDNDKVMVDGFLQSMHAKHATPAMVKSALSWYFAEQEKGNAAQIDLMKTKRREAEDTLRQTWGNSEYRSNINAIKGFMQARFGDRAGGMLEAYLPDGTPLFSNAEYVNDFLNMAREINPAETVVPGATNPAQSIDYELQTITERMKKDWTGYHNDPVMQKRYGELLVAKEKLAARAAG